MQGHEKASKWGTKIGLNGVQVPHKKPNDCLECWEYAKAWQGIAEKMNKAYGSGYMDADLWSIYRHFNTKVHEHNGGNHFFRTKPRPKRKKGKVLDFPDRGKKPQAS